MRENLNYITPTSVCYDGLADNCNIYGRLYNGNDAKTGCPVGWHLPTNAEWTLLFDFLGGGSEAGGKMKEAGETHWATPNQEATNSSGFTGLPGGYYAPNTDSYGQLQTNGYWWSATDESPDEQWFMELRYNSAEAELDDDEPEAFNLSVRCLRD